MKSMIKIFSQKELTFILKFFKINLIKVSNIKKLEHKSYFNQNNLFKKFLYFNNYKIYCNFFFQKNEIQQLNLFLLTKINYTLQKKIFKEKKISFYFSTLMNYRLSKLTYSDFLSKKSFKVLKVQNYLDSLIKINQHITNEICLTSKFLLFIYISFYSLTKKNYLILNIILAIKQRKKKINELFLFNKKELKSKIVLLDLNKTFVLNKKKVKLKTVSLDLNTCLMLSSKKAIKFKTPSITNSIILLTLLENKELKKILNCKLLNLNKFQYLIIRYKILSEIYNEELFLLNRTILSEHYFAYLFKEQIVSKQFLIDKNFNKNLKIFRFNLLSSLLKNKFLKTLKYDFYY